MIGALCVLAASAVAAGGVLEIHSSTCAGQNRDLQVLQNVLTVMLNGPHILNSAADQRVRVIVYDREVAQIKEARCT